MVLQIQPPTQPEVIYLDSDGQPVANNTIQFSWIVEIKQNIEWLFADDPNVFVAGDLFWYPVEGPNKIVNAPDVMVVLGRPKGVDVARRRHRLCRCKKLIWSVSKRYFTFGQWFRLWVYQRGAKTHHTPELGGKLAHPKLNPSLSQANC